MKNAIEIKNRILDIISNSVIRPEMFGHGSFGVEMFFIGILRDISFIDERESELNEQIEKLRKRGLFTSQGVAGQLTHCFLNAENSKETASIYAEIAYNLGYLKIENLSPVSDWSNIYNNIRNYCKNKDWLLKDVVGSFGSPSLAIGSDWQQIHCYVSEDNRNEWIFFDYCNVIIENVDDEFDRYNLKKNQRLRNVRLPSKMFEQGIVFTPYGKKLNNRTKK